MAFSQHSVIVGANRVGKSNFIQAIRLVLDPSLPDTLRYLRSEDFWDGLPRPLKADDTIEVSVDLTHFEDNPDLLALLADSLVSADPMMARITYQFRPLSNLDRAPTSESDYEYIIFGGGNEVNNLAFELRRRVPLIVFEALRDVEADLQRWTRSPLRPLLESLYGSMDPNDLDAIAKQVREAGDLITKQKDVEALTTSISSRLATMAGDNQAFEIALALSPTRPDTLLRSLRVFIDGGQRTVADASLGSANLLFLALKTLDLKRLVVEGFLSFFVLAIEEPEAHLHPHLQRLVYRDFLRTETEGAATADGEGNQRLIIMTTHSPHIVSVAPIRSIVLLKTAPDGSTVAFSTAALDLPEGDLDDLERYLDVNRGEIVFAKGVILVEGIAEEYIVPAFAGVLEYPLDEHGVSVCSVGGTNFSPYVSLLRALAIPHVVITDFDSAGGSNLGLKRAAKLVENALGTEVVDAALADGKLSQLAEQHGVFLNSETLELDLFKAGPVTFCNALGQFGLSAKGLKQVETWRDKPDDIDPASLLAVVDRIGKGRFAQVYCKQVTADECPSYVQKAVAYLAKELDA